MPPKQKVDNSAMRTLKADLAAGRVGRLYLFHGEEAYLREFYVNELRKKLLPPGLDEFNLHLLSGKGCDAARIARAVDCLPVMSERTLILVTDYDLYKAAAAEREAMMALFTDLPDYCCLVFVYDLIEYKPDARTKLFAAIRDRGAVVEFARQTQGDLTDWIARRFRALGREIDTEQARYLIFLCGDLMHNLAAEIGKIGAYAKGVRITRGDIDAVATPQLDAVVFQMTDAIAAGDYDRGAGVLAELLRMQQEPVMILGALGRQLRHLYAARLAYERKKNAAYLAALYGMHPYPAEKLMTAARSVTPERCRRAVVRAFETDLAMKSTGADAGDLLIGLFAELAAAR